MTQVDDIKARVDVVDLVGETVTLRRSGRSFKALCPFHAEKTPSFIVDPDRQSWHCFGACSEGGDIFAWVMRRDGVDFREALHLLAQRAGVALTPQDPHAAARDERRRRLESVNEAALLFFRRQLLESAEAEEARAYVERRGLSDAGREEFGLGYAPDAPTALQSFLAARGFSGEELVAAGVALSAEGGNTVDRFRGRLMFPIRDSRGHCVGFGARTLTGEAAKYINTAQTEIFDKSRLLYGQDRAQAAIRAQDQVVIVEGYLDVIAAHEHGHRNVVASMGTALTEPQVRLVKPLSRNIVLALDADAAGAAATLRGIEITRETVGTEAVPVPDARGLVRLQDELAADIRILELPAGRDPDDLIRRDPQAWATLLGEALPYLDYRFAKAAAAHDLAEPWERAALVDVLLPLVAAISQPVVRAAYVERLARLARVETGVLDTQIKPHRRPGLPLGSALPTADRGHDRLRRRDRQAEFLLHLVINRPEVVEEISTDALTWISDSAARELLRSRLQAADLEAWGAALPTELREQWERLTEEARALPPFSDAEARQAVQQALQRLRTRHLREQLRPQTESISEHERHHHPDTLAEAAAGLSPIGDDLPESDLESAARAIVDHMSKSRELHAPRKDGPP